MKLRYCQFFIYKKQKFAKSPFTIVVSNGRYTFYQIHFIKHNLSNTIYQIPFIKTIYQIPLIKYHLSNTIYQIPFIKYCLSNTIYLISFIKYYLSNTIFCQKSNSHFFNESMNELTECLQNGIFPLKICYKSQPLICCLTLWIRY